jgi:hypothetical protein
MQFGIEFTLQKHLAFVTKISEKCNPSEVQKNQHKTLRIEEKLDVISRI